MGAKGTEELSYGRYQIDLIVAPSTSTLDFVPPITMVFQEFLILARLDETIVRFKEKVFLL